MGSNEGVATPSQGVQDSRDSGLKIHGPYEWFSGKCTRFCTHFGLSCGPLGIKHSSHSIRAERPVKIHIFIKFLLHGYYLFSLWYCEFCRCLLEISRILHFVEKAFLILSDRVDNNALADSALLSSVTCWQKSLVGRFERNLKGNQCISQ